MDQYYRTRLGASQEAIDIEVAVETRIEAPWHVILFNDNVHAFEEVIVQLVRATRCSVRRATEITFEAHTSGRAGAHSGDMESCIRVDAVLSEIGLVTEIRG